MVLMMRGAGACWSRLRSTSPVWPSLVEAHVCLGGHAAVEA